MLKRNLFLVPLCVVVFLAGVYAQQPASTPKTGEFKTLVSKLRNGDTSVDFKALRMATVDSDEEDAGVEADRDAYQKAVAAFNAKKFEDAFKLGEKALKTGYLDPNAHLLMALASEKLSDAKKLEFHKAVYLGLINSILRGADGKSAKTAYVVIAVGEEYALLRALELNRGSQALRTEGGHSYDVLTVTDPKTGKTQDVWFNIDIVMQGYEKIFK